ncbi:MAG: hypothetical protein RJB51_153, partial [Actinomycetota bacterium]
MLKRRRDMLACESQSLFAFKEQSKIAQGASLIARAPSEVDARLASGTPP